MKTSSGVKADQSLNISVLLSNSPPFMDLMGGEFGKVGRDGYGDEDKVGRTVG